MVFLDVVRPVEMGEDCTVAGLGDGSCAVYLCSDAIK